METEFDVIVCGAGAAGSTSAGMLAQDKDLRVLLLEAGPRRRRRFSCSRASADSDPTSAPTIETGYFDDPADLREAVEAYRFAEAITEDEAMRPYRGASVIQGKGSNEEVAAYIRTAANTFWHQCGTARAGVDDGAVVDAELRVHGVENLRVADASVPPRVTSGNTMAPSVVIGYRAAQLIRR
jgi:choline dehydrogenase